MLPRCAFPGKGNRGAEPTHGAGGLASWWDPGPVTTQRERRSLPNLRRPSSRCPGLFQLRQPGPLTLDVNFPEMNSGVFQGPSSPLPPVLSQSGLFGSLGLRGRVPHLAAHKLLSALDGGILINPAAPTLRPVSSDVR